MHSTLEYSGIELNLDVREIGRTFLIQLVNTLPGSTTLLRRWPDLEQLFLPLSLYGVILCVLFGILAFFIYKSKWTYAEKQTLWHARFFL
jgi:hypothetical protein